MPEHFSNFPNINQIKVPEKESAEAVIFRAETNKKIEDLLKTNADLRRVAVLLGAEKYLEVIQRKDSPVYHFNVKAYINDQIKAKTFVNLPDNFLKIDGVILPPDPGEIRTGSGEGIDPKDYIPRSQFLAELLTEMNLNYTVIEGENTPNMMRKLSYYAFIIQKIDKLVLVNNEEGNATFIIHQFKGEIKEAKNYLEMTKEELKNLPLDIFSELIYPGDKDKWKILMKEILKNGPKISEKLINEEKEKKQFLPFEEAREKAREFGFKSYDDYCERYKSVVGLPATPNRIYKNSGWISFGDFLGTRRSKMEKRKPEREISFNEAKEEVRRLGIKTSREYEKRYKLSKLLPYNPENIYKEYWTNWGDFLGTEKLRRNKDKIFSLSEARELCSENNINTQEKYLKEYRNFDNLPGRPDIFYGISWANFFSKEKYFLSLDKVKELILEYGIKSREDYRQEYKNINGLPSDPEIYYKNSGWKNWTDFLGKEAREQILPFEKAREKARMGGFKNCMEYYKGYKNIYGLPRNPNQFYKDWINWADFLGKK